MALLGVLRTVAPEHLAFWCPGCDELHVVRVRQDGQHVSPAWGFNGNHDRPTFTPSILIRSGHYVPGQEGKDCWCTWNDRHPDDPADFECGICHSFVTDGQIQFLNDCTHALAGQTVPLKPPPE